MLHLHKKMRSTWMLCSTVLLFALFISACGQSSAPMPEESPAPSPSAPTEASPQESAGPEAAEQPREVTHIFGTTTIEGSPQKIVSLHPWITDFLVSLDLAPYAAPSAGPNNGEFSWYFEDYLHDTINLGWQIPEVNFESLLSIQPDLMIASQNHDKAYEQLSKISPTIALKPSENEQGIRRMHDTYRELAGMLNVGEKAEEAIAQYDAKAKEARETLAQAVGGESVMFLRITDKELRYYSPKLFEVLYEDLGLAPSAQIPDLANGFEVLSPEILPDINPDHIFLLSESEEKQSSLQELSIWKQLPAVQNGKVYPVDYDLWFQGFGPIANGLIIEDVVQKLTQP